MAITNIVVGAVREGTLPSPLRYLIPLAFTNPQDQVEVAVTIATNVFAIFFNLNSLNGTLFLSAYTLNKSIRYFTGYQCVFGNYINLIDNGCPYYLYFVDQSNGQNYSKNNLPIDYAALSNGVKLYAELR